MLAELTTDEQELLYAAISGDINKIKALLEKKVNLNVQDKDGSTALMLAALTGNIDMVKLLLYSGANANIKDNDGSTASSLAESGGYLEIEKLINEKLRGGGKIKVPEEIEAAGALAFIKARAEELDDRIDRLEASAFDANLINEINHLNILLFTEAGVFYKIADQRTNADIMNILENINSRFEELGKALNLEVKKANVKTFNDKNLEDLLSKDKTMLKEVTSQIYRDITKFLKAEHGIDPGTFAVEYEVYHERLIALREAILSASRQKRERADIKSPELEANTLIIDQKT